MIRIGNEYFRLQGGWFDIVLQIEQFEKIGQDAVETTSKMEACIEAQAIAVEAIEKSAYMRKSFDKRDLSPLLGKQESGCQTGYSGSNDNCVLTIHNS